MDAMHVIGLVGGALTATLTGWRLFVEVHAWKAKRRLPPPPPPKHSPPAKT